MDTAVSVELFVEILNRYVYYFDQQNETVSHQSPHASVPKLTETQQVTTKYLNGLIELVHSNLSTSAAEAGANSANAQQAQAMENPKKHFYRTLEYIRSREFEGVVTEART